MLDAISLKFTENADLVLPTPGITVFVGPNNSGKSLVLREIEQAFNTHPFPSGLKILVDYEVRWPDLNELKRTIDATKKLQPPNLPIGHFNIVKINPNGGVESSTLSESSLFNMVQGKSDKRWFATQFLRYGVLRLDGRSRFNLTNDQSAGDLLAPPQNALAMLFQEDRTRKEAREIISDAFGLYFVIDPTHLGNLRIRLSEKKPLSQEQSLDEKARKFYSEATHVKDASDGVQAFTGIVTAVLSGDYHTILIDEPEAFLHPPLARKLGKYLASLAGKRGGTLMASTHSSDFLMGCVQASQAVRVVRLEHSKGKSRGRMIDPSELSGLLKKPLMRSANVVSGLFHDGVIILESDNDRAFYSEIYHRISSGKPDYPSILFVNAQNKQTIREMMGPLRRFGVPAVAIPDIDFVKDGGKTWSDWLAAAQVPEALHIGYGQQRAAIDAALRNSGKDMAREGGVTLLDGSDKIAAEHFFDGLEEFGIFPVRGGELESWLSELKVPRRKTAWAVAMLERLGDDPLSKEYVRAGTGDVWDFMERIVRWIRNPARKGLS